MIIILKHLDVCGSLKRDKFRTNNNEKPINVAINNSPHFKYKSSLLGKTTTFVGTDRVLKMQK